MREKILSVIEKDSRIDIKELAVILGMDELAVANELKAMEEEGIICGYHTLIDWEKTSIESVGAIIEVRVTPQRGQGFDNIAERIYQYPEVNSVYLISGGFDLPFADIPEGAYYADAVLWASLAGIVRGTDPAHFSPDGIVTRAQCVTLLYRLMGEKQEGDSPFSDVPEDAWYRDAVLWAVSADVTRGKTEVLFAPEDACTRAQIVTFLYRASERS